MIHPEEPIEIDGEAFVDIAVPPEERDRIDHLLDRYDALLAQAEDLSLQIEGLLKEWSPTATPTVGPASNRSPENQFPESDS